MLDEVEFEIEIDNTPDTLEDLLLDSLLRIWHAKRMDQQEDN